MEKRYPISGTFELTGRCNLSCKMCLVRVDAHHMHQEGLSERTKDEWIDMGEQVRKAGTLNLLLTGGEVCIRPDFPAIYEALAQMGFVITVYTNGTMIRDDLMRLFEKWPPHRIGVTIYGSKNETYERLCGSQKGYDRLCEGIQKLLQLPSVIDLRTTLVKENAQDLAEMKAIAKKWLGDENRLHISRFVCRAIRGGMMHPEEVRLTPKEHVQLTESWLMTLIEGVETSKILKRALASMQIKPESSGKWPDAGYLFTDCRAGIDQYTISWCGRMYACGLLNEGYVEPFEIGFNEAWERLIDQYPQRCTPSACKTCPYKLTCETCPAYRLAETGDWFGVPAYACEEAKYKYELYEKLGIVRQELVCYEV